MFASSSPPRWKTGKFLFFEPPPGPESIHQGAAREELLGVTLCHGSFSSAPTARLRQRFRLAN
jgi:hypothetical protein